MIDEAGQQVNLGQVEQSVVDVNPAVILLHELVRVLGRNLLSEI